MKYEEIRVYEDVYVNVNGYGYVCEYEHVGREFAPAFLPYTYPYTPVSPWAENLA